jgi:hypothetical protein
MYATAEFDFSQADNGLLMSGNAFIRALFLIIIFPRLIDLGRKWFASSAKKPSNTAQPHEIDRSILADSAATNGPRDGQSEEEAILPGVTIDKSACQFDLFFLRWSLIVDGLLTALTALATERWHVYMGKLII